MDIDFWLQKWQKNEIGFHEKQVNAMLARYFQALGVEKGSRVFLPLCGKTRDIDWLLQQGYRIAGAELSKVAVEQLFDRLGLQPEKFVENELTHYSASGIDIFLGDIFKLSTAMLGTVDAIYDRAALVALPEKMRYQYTAQLLNLSGAAPQLLITYEYDQNLMQGPPFSVIDEEVRRHYKNTYSITLAKSKDIDGGIKGKCTAQEKVWLLD